MAPLRYTFELARGHETGRPVQQGTEFDWPWNPDREGEYRVKVTIEDARGNLVAGSWSPFYEVAPPLAVQPPTPGKPAPQAAGSAPITWIAAATGGVEPLTYRFELEKDGLIHRDGSDRLGTRLVLAASRIGRVPRAGSGRRRSWQSGGQFLVGALHGGPAASGGTLHHQSSFSPNGRDRAGYLGG